MSGFKSEAQRRKFKELLAKGKITQALYDAFESDTHPTKKLPERAGKKKGGLTPIDELKKEIEKKRLR